MGSGVGSPEADVVEPAVDSEGDDAGVVDSVGADPVVDLAGPVGARAGLGAGGVGSSWGGSVRQRAVRAPVVVFVAESVEQHLELGDRGGLDGLGAQPLLEGLLEPLYLPAGRGVVGSGVLLDDVQTPQFGLEAVAAAFSAGQPGGVDHPVVSECRGRDPVLRNGFTERDDHDRPGDPDMRGDAEGVAGVVIEPGDDLYVRAGPAVRAGEAVVGEVGLSALVRQFGGEP